MMVQKNKGWFPELLRMLLTWLRWRSLETLEGGVLHNLTIASWGPGMIKVWFLGKGYPLGKIKKV